MQERWFALRVRPRAEKQVASSLKAHGYQEFLPLARQRRRWSDRVVDVELPLFPGYVFAKFVVEKRLPVLMITGVTEVVGCGRTPEPIDDEEMLSLQTIVRADRQIDPWPGQYVGQRVRIIAGPLNGAEGTLVSVKHTHRLIVTVSLLQRSVSVELSEREAWPSTPGPMYVNQYAS